MSGKGNSTASSALAAASKQNSDGLRRNRPSDKLKEMNDEAKEIASTDATLLMSQPLCITGGAMR